MFKKMRASPAWLAGRSLTPSPVSFAACVLAGLGLSIVHLLITSVREGAILPNFLDGQWAFVYGTMIQEPINRFLGQATFNNVAIVILWGFAGLLVYTIVEHGLKNYHEWRNAEDDIQLIDPTHVIKHPLQKNFFTALIWRVAVTCMFVVWGIVALLLLQKIVALNVPPLFGIPRDTFMIHLTWLVASWAILLHVLVVLLRLSVRRTRLFGDRHGVSNEITFFKS